MKKLSKDEIFLIGAKLDIVSLINFSKSNKYIYRSLYERDYLWRFKLEKDFPFFKGDIENFYLDNIKSKEIYKIVFITNNLKNELSCPDKIYDIYNYNKINLVNRRIEKINGIGIFINLKYLSLSVNNFTSFPKEIFKLTNLKELSFSSNLLTNIPQEIGNLTNLKTLYLYNNSIKSIPKEIGLLTKLEIFSIFTNEIETIPKEIFNLKKLQRFDVSNNKIREIPFELTLLRNLQHLDLSNNQIKKLPEEIYRIPNLNTHGNF